MRYISTLAIVVNFMAKSIQMYIGILALIPFFMKEAKATYFLTGGPFWVN